MVTHFPVFGADLSFAAVSRLAYGNSAQEAQIPCRFINMEVDVMRELTRAELDFVAGGADLECTPSDGGNKYGGVSDTTSVGRELINIYEGVVAATSHVIERVANALK
jgi:hypothetical protein